MDTKPENTETSTIVCKNCGALLPQESAFCNKCGARTAESLPSETSVQQQAESSEKIVIGFAVAATVGAVLISILLAFFAFPCLLKGHTWMDATCTEPKICSVCAETEGEARGHTWEEEIVIDAMAEYEKSRFTCELCGEQKDF